MTSQPPKKPSPKPPSSNIPVPWSFNPNLMTHSSLLIPPGASVGRGRGTAAAVPPFLMVPPMSFLNQMGRGRGQFGFLYPPAMMAAASLAPPPSNPSRRPPAAGQPSRSARAQKVASKKKPVSKPTPPSKPTVPLTRESLRTKGRSPCRVAAPPQITNDSTRDATSPPLDLTTLIGIAFTSVMSQSHLRNKWLTEAGILAMMKKRYKFKDDFDKTKLHSSITKLTVGCCDIENLTNQTGIFRVHHEITHEGGRREKRSWFYFVTDPGKPMGELPHSTRSLDFKFRKRKADDAPMEVSGESNDSKRKRRRTVMGWNGEAASDKTAGSEIPVDDEPEKMTQKERTQSTREIWREFYSDAQAICDEEVKRLESEQQRASRQQVKDTVDEELERAARFVNVVDMEKKALKRAKETKKRTAKEIGALKVTCYFDSTEAKLLFCPKDGETVQECLRRRIDFLSSAIRDPDACKNLIAEEHRDDDPNHQPTPSQLFQIRDKAMYLRLTYVCALDMLDKGHSYAQCCTKAVEQLQHTTSIKMASVDTVRKLNRDFRKSETFLITGKRRKAAKKLPSNEAEPAGEELGDD